MTKKQRSGGEASPFTETLLLPDDAMGSRAAGQKCCKRSFYQEKSF